jgi:PKD repeat protein
MTLRSGVTRRIAGAGGAFVVVLVAAFVAATPTAPAGTATPPPEQADLLDQVLDWVSEAQSANEDGDFDKADDALKKASKSKRRFIKLLTGQKIYGGGCEVAKVIKLMETVDISLAVAGEVDPKDEDRYYRKTFRAAKNLSKYIRACGKPSPASPAFIKQVKEDAAELVEKAQDAMDPKAVIKPRQFTNLKEDMLLDVEVYGCQVWTIYSQLEAIDRPIDVARFGDFKGEDGADERDTLISKAYNATVELINTWIKVPCGAGGTGGGGDGGGDGGDGGGDGGDGGSGPPILQVSISASPGDPVAGESVAFTAGFSQAADTPTANWDFGDGTKGTGFNVSHVFANPGTYTVTLKMDDGVTQRTETREIVVKAPTCTSPPTVHILSPADPLAGDGSRVQIELSGQCFELNRAGATTQSATAPGSNKWSGYNVKTEGDCGAPTVAVATIECQVKPSGEVCWHLEGESTLQAGDTVIYRVKRNGVVILDQLMTVGPAAAASCTP